MNSRETLLRCSLARREFDMHVDLALPGEHITAVFGASGSGKTTLLRCIAGLERASDARIEVAGETWQDEARGIFLPTWRRPLGYVFQEASLFDHLDVRGNIEFARRRSGAGASDGDVARLLGIEHLLARRPHELSGGERQRVAIARALATQPRILLLDEPLAAIDLARRREILPWLEKLRDELRIPMLYVTHSADEVARLADHLVLLDQGKVVAAGPIAQTLARLDLPVVLGEDAGALLQGRIVERDSKWRLARVEFAGGSLWLRDSGFDTGRAVRVRVLARDVSIALVKPEATSVQNILACTVEALAADSHPSQVTVRLACGETTLLARITARAADALTLSPGLPVWAQVKSAALVD
jgi:molybdate transport system ATP-binding protein